MAREERSGNGCGGSSSSTILQFVPFCSLVDEGFWQRLSYLKLNKYGIDDSPIPITGFYAPCSHSRVSNHLTLLAESLPTDENGQSSMPAIVVTGTDALYPGPFIIQIHWRPSMPWIKGAC